MWRLPENPRPASDIGLLRAPLARSGDDLAIELRVAAPEGATAQPRLDGDAALLGALMDLESLVSAMTIDLSDVQEQLLALYALAETTRTLVSPDETLAAAAAHAQRTLGATAGAALLSLPPEHPDHQPGRLPQLGWHHADGKVAPDEVPAELLATASSLKHTVVRQPPELLVPGAARALITPLTVAISGDVHGARRAVGALAVLDATAGTYGNPQRKLLEAIATSVGAHLEAVLKTRLEKEAELAAEVQRRILPTAIPILPEGIDVYGACRPGGASGTSGDFFDLLCADERTGGLWLAVGDVSGKGLAAALLTTMVLQAMRSRSRAAPQATPAEMLARLSEDLYEDLSEAGRFVTLFVARLSADGSVLQWANAGHGPVLLHGADGRTQLLEAGAPPLGVLPDLDAAAEEHLMAAGDVLVAATDGLSEARNPAGDMFGQARLTSALTELADRPADALTEGLLTAVERFAAGRPAEDDRTLVTLKSAAR